jgi:hypothetical protein
MKEGAFMGEAFTEEALAEAEAVTDENDFITAIVPIKGG